LNKPETTPPTYFHHIRDGTLAVPSSVTAEQFYSKLGFSAVHDSYHGEERTIVMERNLAEP